MRRLIVFGLVFLTPLIVLAAAWSPLRWSFDESAIAKAFQELRAAGDPLLARVEAIDPQIEKALTAKVVGVFSKSTNDRLLPLVGTAFNSIHKYYLLPPESQNFDSITGKFLGALVPESLRDVEKGTKYSYRICEVQPTAKECIEWSQATYFGENAFTSLGRAFARRVLSTQAVAEGAYKGLLPLARWTLRWNKHIFFYWDEDPLAILREQLAELKSELVQKYLAKPWSASLCDQEGHSLEGFICRRYLDGGPILILKYVELLERAAKEITPMDFPEDQLAWSHINDIFAFQKTPAAGKTYWIQTKRISAEDLVRITKLAPLGTPVEFDRNEKFEIGRETALVLGDWLSGLDSRFKYRLATEAELRESDPPITFPCVFDHVPTKENSWSAELVKVGGEQYFDCEARDLVFIRE